MAVAIRRGILVAVVLPNKLLKDSKKLLDIGWLFCAMICCPQIFRDLIIRQMGDRPCTRVA